MFSGWRFFWQYKCFSCPWSSVTGSWTKNYFTSVFTLNSLKISVVCISDLKQLRGINDAVFFGKNSSFGFNMIKPTKAIFLFWSIEVITWAMLHNTYFRFLQITIQKMVGNVKNTHTKKTKKMFSKTKIISLYNSYQLWVVTWE